MGSFVSSKTEFVPLPEDKVTEIFSDPSWSTKVENNWRDYLRLLKVFEVTAEQKPFVDAIANMATLCMDSPPPCPYNMRVVLVPLLAWLAANEEISKRTNGQQGFNCKFTLPRSVGQAGYDQLLRCAEVTDQISDWLKKAVKRLSEEGGQDLTELFISSARTKDETELKDIMTKIGTAIDTARSNREQENIEKIKTAVVKLETDETFQKVCLGEGEQCLFQILLDLLQDRQDAVADLKSVRNAYHAGDSSVKKQYQQLLFAMGLEASARSIGRLDFGLEKIGLGDRVNPALDACLKLSKRSHVGNDSPSKRVKNLAPTEDQ